MGAPVHRLVESTASDLVMAQGAALSAALDRACQILERATLRPLSGSPDPEQLATAVFVLGKHPREEPLVGLVASLLREHVQAGDPEVLYQALIALENWGEEFGVRGWAILDVEENRRRAKAWLGRQ